MSLGDKMEKSDDLKMLPDEVVVEDILCTREWEAMINQSDRWNKKWSCFIHVCIILMFAGGAAAGDTGTIAKQVGKSATYYRALKGTANMPNLCLICFSAFISSAALAQHLIGKHSDLDCFECSHCGKKGKQKNNVQNYCIKRHKEIDFEINKINIDEVERFIQKHSFKGTKEEYDKMIKSKKTDIVSEKTHNKVAKIIKCSTYSVCKKHNEDCDCDKREILVPGKNGCRYKFKLDSFSVCDTHNNNCSCSNREVFTVGLRGCVKRHNDSGNDTYSICRVHTKKQGGCACENRVEYTAGVNGCIKLFTTDTISVCRKGKPLGGCDFACINEHEYYTVGIDGCKKHTEDDGKKLVKNVASTLSLPPQNRYEHLVHLTDNHYPIFQTRDKLVLDKVESDCVVSSPRSSCVLTGYTVGQRAALCDAEQTQELCPRTRSLLYVFDDCPHEGWSELKSHGIEVDQNKSNIITSRDSHSESQTQLNELVKSVWNVSDLMRKTISHKYEVPSSEMKPEPVLDNQSSAETLQQAHDKVVDGSDSSEIHMYNWMKSESSNIGLVMPNTIDARIKTLLSNKLGQFIEEVKLLTSL